jgi:MoxR-like ATPase
VLLIDEIDRGDEELEAYLLEALSTYSVSVPELGTVAAAVPPVVVLTSNRTRALHDALARRCLFHWLGHPSRDREVRIVHLRCPQVPLGLVEEITEVCDRLRALDLDKPPGVAEAVDWATALGALGITSLADRGVSRTLGTVLKNRADLERVVERGTDELLGPLASGG